MERTPRVTLDAIIESLSTRAEKPWAPIIPQLSLALIDEKYSAELSLDLCTKRKVESRATRKNRNGKRLGHFYGNVVNGYWGGTFLNKTLPHHVTDKNAISYPDVVNSEKSKVLESKGTNHKNEGLLKKKQLHSYVSAQTLDSRNQYSYVVFRHGWQGVLSDFQGTQQDLFSELKNTPAYCVEFPVSLLFGMWLHDPAAYRTAPYVSKEQAVSVRKNPETAADSELVCISKKFFEEVAEKPQERIQVITKEIGEHFSVHYRILSGLQIDGVQIPNIPLLRFRDRSHEQSVKYMRDNAWVLMNSAETAGKTLANELQHSLL